MSQILSRFTLDPSKITISVFACMVIIWGMVVGCTLASIARHGYPRWQRLCWTAMVVGLPVLGVLAYLPFSFRKEEDTLILNLLPNIFINKNKH